MRLTPPKKIVFIISLLLVILSVVAHFVKIPVATPYQYWVMLAGWVILAAGVALKGV